MRIILGYTCASVVIFWVYTMTNTRNHSFKLHLDPSSSEMQKPELPEGITPIQAYADMLSYLMNRVKESIIQAHPSIEDDWTEISTDHAEYIITHPNHWGGQQQWKLRQAAVKAGLVPDTVDGHSRVNFVTDGEAVLHFCVRYEPLILVRHFLLCFRINSVFLMTGKSKQAVIVADLGAGSAKFNAYKPTGDGQHHFVESAAPFGMTSQYLQPNLVVTRYTGSPEGSNAIYSRIRSLLERAHLPPHPPLNLLIHTTLDRLRHSIFNAPDYIEHMVEVFEKTSVPMFRSEDDICVIKFGMPSDTDYAHGIKHGAIRLSGYVLEYSVYAF